MSQKPPPVYDSLISTAIPYVNAAPHLGYALEAVVADCLARFRRASGLIVHHQAGTDENSLKNARAAEALGIPTERLVEENADRFFQLGELLSLSWDGFVRTSRDPLHRRTVRHIWQRCLDQGDIYPASYQGLYCVGCEQFYNENELNQGLCPEHGSPAELVCENNYFFRLSRYAERLRELIESDALQILPAASKHEVLGWLDNGLTDFSVSRSRERARGWGIAVPGDASQVIYVWYDALINYITGLGEDNLEAWQRAGRIEHVIGKGILRFHALYWPAILLSAGLRLPNRVLVHGYLTVEGLKIGKSLGNVIDPERIVRAHGLDAVRYYLLRHVRTTRDGDFSERRLSEARAAELADQLGNLVQRSLALVVRARAGRAPVGKRRGPLEEELALLAEVVEREVTGAVEAFALHDALASIFGLIAAANRYIDRTEPWKLLAREAAGAAPEPLDQVLEALLGTLRTIALLLGPFLPETAGEIARRVGAPGACVEPGPPLFPKRPYGSLGSSSQSGNSPPEAATTSRVPSTRTSRPGPKGNALPSDAAPDSVASSNCQRSAVTPLPSSKTAS